MGAILQAPQKITEMRDTCHLPQRVVMTPMWFAAMVKHRAGMQPISARPTQPRTGNGIGRILANNGQTKDNEKKK